MNEKSIWDKFGVWIIGIIVRWTFKVLSGVLLAVGIEQDQWELWIGAIVSFIIGILITKYQNAYLKNSFPPVK